MEQKDSGEFINLRVDVDQTRFYRQCLLELNDVLDKVLGNDESTAFVGLVASRLADFFISAYREAHGRRHYSPMQLAQLLIDLKTRIGGDFYVSDITGRKIVLRNRQCPFGKGVLGKSSLCSMTAGVFGKVVAESNQYAAVSVDEAIAKGDAQCKVTILLQAEDNSDGHYREFFDVR
ncbi:methanogen output domain 1-containing protein [Alteromonas oceani]|uniref:Methanogen output domain 1-containing protein n=1 Tax=Alteromonas oceani TaxID=2071609 RepID=A0ABV7JWD6_9ALTE|nr:methanogen output domain 1-containing protein [Alteromonas oceani]|tara:strand:+ start:562 stop:1092 length:531 start_codon:yes stop_codon:yes gene_type:complete